MRMINLANDKKRDAQVGFELSRSKSSVSYQCADGSPRKNVRLLKNTLATDLSELLKNHGDEQKLAEAMLAGDPEIDLEKCGMQLGSTHKVYLTADNRIAYSVSLAEAVYNPDGTEKEIRPYTTSEANVAGEVPLRWTGKLIPKAKAIRMFVFARKYQIKHVSGLTFDFLFDMAKTLEASQSLLLLGGGAKGTEPLVFSQGGTAYRGFLEGRIRNQEYCLILHLTNLELKVIP